MRTTILSLILITGTACLESVAENTGSELVGAWEGHSTAGRATYKVIVITNTKISWKGDGSSCDTKYTVIERKTSDRYPNMGGKPLPGVTYNLYKIKLGPPDCANSSTGFFLFAIPSNSILYGEVMGFDRDGHSSGSMDVFSRSVIK